MSIDARKVIFDEIKKIRKNPIISYVTSIRPNISSQISPDAIPSIIEQIDFLEDSEEIDLIIISNGGDSITALRIINLLRERYKKINVLVPYVAYSAATILALGADTLVMTRNSNLGPVDPQITSKKPNERGLTNPIQFSSEDVKFFVEFLKKDAKIHNGAISSILLPLVNEAGPLAIGFSKRSQQLSLDLSRKLLGQHIKNKHKINVITKCINKSYDHSYAISRLEAKKIGLNVLIPSQEVENLLWKLWKDYEADLRCNDAFDLTTEVMSNPGIASRIKNYSTVQLPINLPQNITQGLIGQLLNQSGSLTIVPNTTTSIPITHACIESVHEAIHFVTTFEVSVWRNLDMNLGINAIQLIKGWVRI